MIGRLLCRAGLHCWSYPRGGGRLDFNSGDRLCVRCAKQQRVAPGLSRVCSLAMEPSFDPVWEDVPLTYAWPPMPGPIGVKPPPPPQPPERRR